MHGCLYRNCSLYYIIRKVPKMLLCNFNSIVTVAEKVIMSVQGVCPFVFLSLCQWVLSWLNHLTNYLECWHGGCIDLDANYYDIKGQGQRISCAFQPTTRKEGYRSKKRSPKSKVKVNKNKVNVVSWSFPPMNLQEI